MAEPQDHQKYSKNFLKANVCFLSHFFLWDSSCTKNKNTIQVGFGCSLQNWYLWQMQNWMLNVKCLRFQVLVFMMCACKFIWTVSISQSEALEKYCHFSCLRPQLIWIQYWSWNCSEKLKKRKRKWWKVLMFSIIYSLFSPLHFHSRDSNEFYECKVSAIGFSVETSKFMVPWGITGTDNA